MCKYLRVRGLATAQFGWSLPETDSPDTTTYNNTTISSMSTCTQPTIRVSNIGISFYIYGRLQAADDTH